MPLFSGKCKSKARLDGKTAVITGCNTGIGKETVRDFINRGCRVIMACRDVTKAEQAAKDIKKETVVIGVIVVVRLDLSSFASVRQCAAQLLDTEPAINLLINNAGVAMCPKSLTEDGFETQFATNHLGHFLFTLLLLPRILASVPARIVNVSSLGHTVGDINFDDINSEKSYSPMPVYAQSKLANILFSAELARRLQDTGVTTYSLHPGVVNTEVMRHTDTAVMPGSQWFMKHIVGPVLKTPVQGAQTTIHCAIDEKAGEETGLYYSDCKKTKPSSKARDPKLALKLWEESLKMVGLEQHDSFTPELFKEDLVQDDLVRGDPVQEDLVRGILVQEDLVNGDLVQEDLVRGDLLQEDLVNGDLVQEDLVRENLLQEDLVNGDFVQEDVMGKEYINEKHIQEDDPKIQTTEL